MPESCFECQEDATVLIQDITDDFDPELYCRKHDPRGNVAVDAPSDLPETSQPGAS